jgi:hypothetical protein
MNCALCIGYQREKNRCQGCRGDDEGKPASCVACRIGNCERMKKRFCFSCDMFPCRRLKQLDKRYRLRYGMSMIENLSVIEKNGVREFVRREKARWVCPGCGNLLSVHRRACPHCGRERNGIPIPPAR